MITKSGNFKLVKKVNSLDEFWNATNNHDSIFARHRMYPSAFFMGWPLRLVKMWLHNGWFYTAIKITKTKTEKWNNKKTKQK